jgi:hypothetical protein
MIEVKLVPTACWGMKLKRTVSSGTMKIPPPTPVKEAMMPTKNPETGRSNKSHIVTCQDHRKGDRA